jgi:Fe-S cluster assembly scaffold protein SufB
MEILNDIQKQISSRHSRVGGNPGFIAPTLDPRICEDDDSIHYQYENAGGVNVLRQKEGIEITVESEVNAIFEFSSEIKNEGSDSIFILAKENSVLHIFENVKSDTAVSFERKIFITVEKGAKVIFAEIADLQQGSSLILHKSSKVFADGKMEWYDLHAGAETVHSFTEDTLAENGAESSSYVLAISSEEKFEIHNIIHHEADNTTSHIFARGIAGGNGKIIYRALSDIKKGISGATGRQDGRFLITGSGAEIDAIPSLDIASSESNSSHAISISHLAEKDFFYPALRGIAPYRAQAMLLSGFLTKHLEKLPENWQSKFTEKINKKLSSPLFRMGE